MPNSRSIRNWTPKKASDYPVSPHRYLWDREAVEDNLAIPGSGPIREWKALLPYKRNEVIMVERNGKPVKAMVLDIVVDYDRYGDRRACYQCATETKTGFFSQVWSRFYAGHVQRGYLLAGMAPDLAGKM